jgi:hypothetical protein
MAIIPQTELFSWKQIDAASDMQRLILVLGALPDESLMRALEARRKGRRDDYPVRAVWNSLIAGMVFQHATIELLRRELMRNAELRQVCGFDLFKGADAVPPAWVYSRFQRSLSQCAALVEAMFHDLVEQLKTQLPDLGTHLAIDGKALPSFGNPPKKDKVREQDGRRDTDANWGVKQYKGARADGSVWHKTKRWFGFKLHLLVDSVHELPLAYRVTKASANDSPELPNILEQLERAHPGIARDAQFLSADKGYDSRENHEAAFDQHGIKPVIDKRNDWQDEPHLPRPLNPDRVDTIFYNANGAVLCRCRDGAQHEPDNYEPMVYQGYEHDRRALKYRCPAIAKGVGCTQRGLCNGCHSGHGRIVRVGIDRDMRQFPPLPRNTPAWHKQYNKRSAVERVNSRIDTVFGFERHTIRGQRKMHLRIGLALTIMLALAAGRINANQRDNIRSLIRAA